MKTLTISIFLILSGASLSQANWQKGGNTANGGTQSTIGTDASWNAPFQFLTYGQARMHINNASGLNAGYIGIGQNFTNPQAPLHVVGSGSFTQGWKKAITISNQGSLTFIKDGSGANNDFLIAAPSSSPNGDLYFGAVSSINNPSAPVFYSQSIVGQNNPPGLGLPGSMTLASSKFYTNTYIKSSTGEERYLGINTYEPKRILDVVGDNGDAQLRITRIENDNPFIGNYADFHVNNAGLNIIPMRAGNKRPVLIHNDPTAFTDVYLIVNGNGQFRGLPDNLYNAPPAVNKVVMTDDEGVLMWRDINQISPFAAALNATWINPATNELEWGTNPLLHDTEVPMADHNVLFKTYPSSPGTVTIGGAAFNLDARLTVENDVYTIGQRIRSMGPQTGIKFGLNAYATNANRLTAVYGDATAGINVEGVSGKATAGTSNTMGVQGYASSNSGLIFGGKFTSTGNTNDESYGVNAYANASQKTNIGGYFIGSGGTTTIGVYGEGNATLGQAYAGYFAGQIITGAPAIPSDIQFKTNVISINNASDLIDNLNPVTYQYQQSGNAEYLNFPSGLQYGMIAQEVETTIPELVKTVTHPQRLDSLGNVVVPEFDYKTLNYEALIPVLIKGHQEQQTLINSKDSIINDLNNRLTLLENCLSNILPALCQANAAAVQQTPQQVQEELLEVIDVNLSDKNTLILNQNVPNPFAERTVISYSIPVTVGKAQMHFYDGQGKLIQSVDITERGQGQLNVFASDLSSGLYTYSLVADGKVVATKRMVKE